MQSLEQLAVRASVKLCEHLPLNLTLYEEQGRCTSPSKDCIYCREHKDILYCHKKTYTADLAG